jgi:hypothetical protein
MQGELPKPRRTARVRELHEVEEFVSEEEEHVLVNEDEIEFESDDEVCYKPMTMEVRRTNA